MGEKRDDEYGKKMSASRKIHSFMDKFIHFFSYIYIGREGKWER